MNNNNPLSPPPRDRDGARRKALNHFAASEQRDSAVKLEINRERAANDAKTAKLRALRLAKEEYDRANPPPPVVKAKAAPRRKKAAV